MTLTAPIPFAEALRRLGGLKLLPTALDSAGIAGLAQQVRDSNLFSARTLERQILDGYKAKLGERLAGNLSQAEVRLFIKQLWHGLGYSPAPEDKDTVKDLASDERINLVTQFQTTSARAYGQQLKTAEPGFLDAWPASELVRFQSRHEPRDWAVIWESGCVQAGDDTALSAFKRTGRMVALQNSGVWLAISDFGRPWAPFKFGSGMGRRNVSRRDAMELGLIDRNTQVNMELLPYNLGLEAAN